MNFFDMEFEAQKKKNAPLADRMRPDSPDEVYGQEHLLGKGMPIRRMLDEGTVRSMILVGPPGTGKTTIAKMIAQSVHYAFLELSAVTSGVKDLREEIARAKEIAATERRSSILFIDEIHRYNKAQQDALLPYVEQGVVTLIGATTENPFFSVNKALLSRVQVFRLKALSDDATEQTIRRALEKDEKLAQEKINLTPDGMDLLVRLAGGDARSALNMLELTVLSAPLGKEIVVDHDAVTSAVQVMAGKYDADGDEHYNTISAFIKSVRGSDPDAAIYYLARMIEAGEDPLFIARRLIILASEDIGNADPRGITVAVAAFHAVNHIGMPEGRIPLAQATIYLASAPKSNAAYLAIDEALAFVRKNARTSIPKYLMDTHTLEAGEREQSYLYPHDYGGYVEQIYLPEEAEDEHFYRPTTNGYEAKMAAYLEYLRGKREK